MKTTITIHEQKDTARIAVRLWSGEKDQSVIHPEQRPIRRVLVFAVKSPAQPGDAPVAVLDSHQHTREGHALVWMPCRELELVGDVKLYDSGKAFLSPIQWGCRTDPLNETIAVLGITINGHPYA